MLLKSETYGFGPFPDLFAVLLLHPGGATMILLLIEVCSDTLKIIIQSIKAKKKILVYWAAFSD